MKNVQEEQILTALRQAEAGTKVARPVVSTASVMGLGAAFLVA